MNGRVPWVRARHRAGAYRVALAAWLAAATSACVLLPDPEPQMLRRRSALARTVEQSGTRDGDYWTTRVRLEATSGLAVDVVVRRAIADTGRRLPLAVVLGGHHTGAEAAAMLGDTRGVVVAAVSYPFGGDPRPDAATFLREIPAIRRAFVDTPPALMLALDYLRELPEVDTARVEAVGVSLGAPFVCIAGALDARFTRVWAIHGSGGSYVPLEANMRRTIPWSPLRAAAAGIANLLIDGPGLDPVRWVPRIAPRPFVMVNARDDERLPRRAVDALFAAARPPREQLWMSGGHVHADSATIRRLAEIVIARVRATSDSGLGRAPR